LNETGAFGKDVVTEIQPLKEFYPAEEYHRNYYQNNPGAGYCQAVITPKLEKFRKKYASLLKPA
jgi:peptide methionine sulfoxide reductase MsrA